MYFHSFREFLWEMMLVFREKRFFYSVKYCLWVIWDRIRGVDFVKNVGYTKAGTSRNRSVVYQATRDISFLKKILKEFKITHKDAILDLGCGKGYMLKVFYKYPFGKLGGVELSEYLYHIANDNILKCKMDDKCTVYHEDASDFKRYDEYNYIYMFNPFPGVVMKDVMENIKSSIKRKPRKIVIIYKVPACHDIIMESGIFEVLKIIEGKTAPYYVYSSHI